MEMWKRNREQGKYLAKVFGKLRPGSRLVECPAAALIVGRCCWNLTDGLVTTLNFFLSFLDPILSLFSPSLGFRLFEELGKFWNRCEVVGTTELRGSLETADAEEVVEKETVGAGTGKRAR